MRTPSGKRASASAERAWSRTGRSRSSGGARFFFTTSRCTSPALLGETVEHEPPCVSFDPEHELEGFRAGRSRSNGTVPARRPFALVAPTDLEQPVELAPHVTRTLEHQDLEEVREAAPARRLVGGPERGTRGSPPRAAAMDLGAGSTVKEAVVEQRTGRKLWRWRGVAPPPRRWRERRLGERQFDRRPRRTTHRGRRRREPKPSQVPQTLEQKPWLEDAFCSLRADPRTSHTSEFSRTAS